MPMKEGSGTGNESLKLISQGTPKSGESIHCIGSISCPLIELNGQSEPRSTI